jgi:YhcH/YjgK/YiaL family protein
MIVDAIPQWKQYFRLPAWQSAFDFLQSATPALEDKRHIIQGEDVFALVSTYHTKAPDTAVLEAHRQYLDIQVLLAGVEFLDWYPLAGLSIKTPYVKDVEFFHHPASRELRVRLEPGFFAALFPGDAHRPQIVAGSESQLVKKAVIKINLDRLKP